MDRAAHPLTLSSFRYEAGDLISEDEYLARQGVGQPRTKKTRFYLIGFTMIGIAALFVGPAAPFGGIVLAICLAAWTAPRWMAWAARRSYRDAKYLNGPLTYGVSDDKVWFRGATLYAESSWNGVAVWEETDGILRLSAHGLPSLRFRIEELRAAGIYDSIRSLMLKHAIEFDSQEARRKTAS